MRLLLEHSKARGLQGIAGFELGNELFAPPHLTPATAAADIGKAAKLFAEIFGDGGSPNNSSSSSSSSSGGDDGAGG